MALPVHTNGLLRTEQPFRTQSHQKKGATKKFPTLATANPLPINATPRAVCNTVLCLAVWTDNLIKDFLHKVLCFSKRNGDIAGKNQPTLLQNRRAAAQLATAPAQDTPATATNTNPTDVVGYSVNPTPAAHPTINASPNKELTLFMAFLR